MLASETASLLDRFRMIKKKLDANAPPSYEEMAMMKHIDKHVSGCRQQCEATLEALNAIDYAGLTALFQKGEPDPVALKKEVDAILGTLEKHDQD